MSDLEFKPIHKFIRVTISSIETTKNTNSDINSMHVYNNSPFKITLLLGLSGYCETKEIIFPTIGIAYKVNIVLNLLDIRQSRILNEDLIKDSIS